MAIAPDIETRDATNNLDMKKITEEQLEAAQKALGVRKGKRNPKNSIDWDSIILAPVENEPAVMAGVGLEEGKSSS